MRKVFMYKTLSTTNLGVLQKSQIVEVPDSFANELVAKMAGEFADDGPEAGSEKITLIDANGTKEFENVESAEKAKNENDAKEPKRVEMKKRQSKKI